MNYLKVRPLSLLMLSFVLLVIMAFIWTSPVVGANNIYTLPNNVAALTKAKPNYDNEVQGYVKYPVVNQNVALTQSPVATPIFYPAFTADNTDNLVLVGDAQLYTADLALRLTDAAPCCQSGAAWQGEKQQVGDGFLTVFDFRVTDIATGGADGLAFVIQDAADGSTTQGGGGCGVGYTGIERSLAIEIDTFANPPFCESNQDPNGNHISIQTRGMLPNSPEQQYSRGVYTPTTNLSDGDIHTLMVHYESGILAVYLDIDTLTPEATPIITTAIDLSAELGLLDGMAWVGFVAGTGTTVETHDIHSWYFLDEWDLSCVTYEYDRERAASYNFNPAPPEEGRWPTEGKGWETTLGTLAIDRGINFYISEPVPNVNDGFDPRILNLMNPPTGSSVSPYPIEQIRLIYEWVNRPSNVSLQGEYQLLVEGNNIPLSDSWVITDGVQLGNGWYQTAVNLNNSQAIRPQGLRLSMTASDANAVLRLKRASLCIDTGSPPRPPVVPPGAAQACADLLQNIKTRQQPFGQSGGNLIPSQPEFQFPSDVTLEPYPEYQLGANGYPDSLTYHILLADDLLVPCVFKQNGAYYDPDPGAAIPFQPIIRFTTTSNNPFLHESLTLLNYSGYFSVGSRDDWCYARDNVFGNIYDRVNREDYLPGYNVPPPRNHCLDPNQGGIAAGPCGSFMGSLFRAMGYFNVPAFADVYDTLGVKYAIGNLYYGVNAYVNALPDQQINNVVDPFVDVDYGNLTVYTTNPVTYNAIRVYPLLDGAKIYGLYRNGRPIDPIRCESSGDGLSDCDLARRLVSGHWHRPTIIELYQGNTLTDPDTIWQNIKAGDIATTVIETAEPPNPQGVRGPDINTHVQVVVGWGPKMFNQSVRSGFNLYPTYQSLPPGEEDEFVPYVMDRGSLPGTGGVTGPRPFSYDLWHTATTFWVADTPIPSLPIEQTAVMSTPTINISSPEFTPVIEQGEVNGPMPASVSSSVAWQSVGDHIALGNRDGLYLYTSDLASFTTIDTGAVADIAWSPDGQYLLAGLATQQAKVWDVANDELAAVLAEHTAELTSVSWSPDGNTMATTAKDGRFYLWDAATFSLKQTVAYTGSSYLTAQSWSADSTKLAGLDMANLYVWDAVSGDLLHTISNVGATGNAVAWMPDGQHVAVAGSHVWNVVTGQPVGDSYSCSSGTDTVMSLGPDGGQIARSGIAADGAAICVDSLDSQFFQEELLLLEAPEYFSGVGDIAWQPNGQQVVVASQEGWLSTWSVVDGSLVAVGAKPNTTIDEIEYWLRRCTTSGTEEYTLFNLFLAEDYATFATTIEASSTIQPFCAPYLTAVSDFYSENEPPGTPVEVVPQPLTVQSACPALIDGIYQWRIENPNAYDVVVYWGWSESAPELNTASVVIPAGTDWVLTTPMQGNNQTLRLISGDFETTAVYSAMSCTLRLPLVLR